MTRVAPQGRPKGDSINITVEPSTRIVDENSGFMSA